MKKFKKILQVILIILFPLGILYCVGKNLFGSNFAGFLGGVLLFVIGGIASLFIFAPEVMSPVVNFFKWLF